MNEWLIAAIVLLALLVPLGLVCFFAGAIDGLVALQLGGTNGALVLLLLSEGIARQSFADLAIVMALLSFVGSLSFAYFLERSP